MKIVLQVELSPAHCKQCIMTYHVFQCADINECDDISDVLLCHKCENSVGSYQCNCDNGYEEINNGTLVYCEGESDVT